MNNSALIISKLEANGISATGMYASLIDIVATGVETTKEFGYDFWLARTTAGPKIREIVKELSNQ